MDTDTDGLNQPSAVSGQQSAEETVETTEAQREPTIETTEAKRTKKKSRNRKMQAELQKMLSMKKCQHCLTVGQWKIVSTQGRVRYIKCQACGRTAQAVTER